MSDQEPIVVSSTQSLTSPSKPEPEKPKPLSPKHLAFAIAYVSTLNASAAYKVAYPRASYKTCRTNGSELLANTDIRAEIDRRMAETVMPPSEVLRRLSDQASASLMPFVRITDEGFVYFNFNDPQAKNYMHLIKRIKSKRTRRVEGTGKNAELWEDEWVEVELYDAQAALRDLGRHYQLFKDETHIDLTSAGDKIQLTPDQISVKVAVLVALAEQRKAEITGGSNE